MKQRWTLATPQPMLAEQIAQTFKLSPLLAQCLVNRGISEPSQVADFLAPKLAQLSDPFLLPNMETAIARLLRAREEKERVVIFGDYDVDGVASTTLLLEALRLFGLNVEPYLPHRLEEGYGLSQDGVEHCLKKYPSTLLLAVDCGSTAVASIAWLRQQGVDVVVLDHHQCSDPLPEALAIVNPQLLPKSAGSQPFSDLCSAGLAFKLIHALVKRGREIGVPEAASFDIRPLLDLVALATVADIVPLTGENRILTAAGLERLGSTKRPGLMALKQVAQAPRVIGTYEAGFQLGPRLNAAGRLETAEESLQLLLAPTLETATALAHNLDARNRERQQIERSIAEEVIGAIRASFNPETDYVIVEGQLRWHIGVVGIVASRVVQQFHRPTIIIGGEGVNWRGSGRSIDGFDLAAALRQCDDLLIRHGGHAMAAGVTVHPDNLDALRTRLNRIARETLQPDQLQPRLRLDAEAPISEITMERIAELDRLKPFGPNNPSVHFMARGVTLRKPPFRMGRENRHVKMWLNGAKEAVEAVWWAAGEEELPTGRFDLAYSPQINVFNGRRNVQLKVLGWRPAE